MAGVPACATGAADDGVAERNTRSVRRSAEAPKVTMMMAKKRGLEDVRFWLNVVGGSFGIPS